MAERAHGGEAVGDDLADADEFGVVAGGVGVDGGQCRHAGDGEVSTAGTEEHAGEDGDDEMQQDLGGVDGRVLG